MDETPFGTVDAWVQRVSPRSGLAEVTGSSATALVGQTLATSLDFTLVEDVSQVPAAAVAADAEPGAAESLLPRILASGNTCALDLHFVERGRLAVDALTVDGFLQLTVDADTTAFPWGGFRSEEQVVAVDPTSPLAFLDDGQTLLSNFDEDATGAMTVRLENHSNGWLELVVP